jgi:prepilin-type N-terminal cleavage/methylation domain-containing protein
MSRSNRQSVRSAFTLVELLVAVAIIAIISSFALGAMYLAQEQAREAKTRSLIARINNQIMARYEALKTRRLPIDVTEGLDPTLANYAQKVALRQLLARRQLARMELPDRWADVAWDDRTWTTSPAYPNERYWATGAMNAPEAWSTAPAFPTPWAISGVSRINWAGLYGFTQTDRRYACRMSKNMSSRPAVTAATANLLDYRTAMSEAYRGRYQQIKSRGTTTKSAGLPPTVQFEGPECLYMILTTITTDETLGNEQFHASEIGDVDGDGAPEFIDGWGQPIGFLRWAPGFISDMQYPDPVNAHDGFDPMGVDPIAYNLTPLVFSFGPDRDGGLELHTVDDSPETALSGTTNDFNDPFFFDPSDPANKNFTLRGTSQGNNHLDNIHSHALTSP